MTTAKRRAGDEDANRGQPPESSAASDDQTLRSSSANVASSASVAVVNQTPWPIDDALIVSAVQAAMARESHRSVEVSVAVVDDEAIHRLNAQFLKHDYPTDVLSFLLADDAAKLEGELVVCAETAARCAVDAGWDAADELLLYVVHGALHLAGFDDSSAPQAAVMRNAEAQTLRSIGVALSHTDERWQDQDLLNRYTSHRGIM